MPDTSSNEMARPRVLLVEGDEALQGLVFEMLSDAGCETHLSPNGDAALEMVRANAAFNAVVLDVQTAVIDARTFLRRLRRVAPDTPVVLLSAHSPLSMTSELGVAVVQTPPERQAMIQALRLTLYTA